MAFGAFGVVEVVLYGIEGLRYEEIARILGVARGTVRSRMQRARQALQSELRERISHSARRATS
jgi:DNA-directed RNA polymerase specialized sigma24 family protein